MNSFLTHFCFAAFGFLALIHSASSLACAGDKHLGVATCASSQCHGSVSPRATRNVLQNEYVTWHRHGVHAKAWKTLLNSDSKKIARNLGIKSPEKSAECLLCHTTYVPNQAERGKKYRIQDGVSCEGCHGPAERWIRSHTASGRTYQQNIADGLSDIYPLEKRAGLCLSCHLGTTDKVVDHRLIGAGHPRLTFELDTFSLIQPNHWSVDRDYRKRKGGYDSAKAWMLGQVIRASEQLAFAKRELPGQGKTFPDFSNYYCYSCHHSLKEDQWKKRDYKGRPGELRLNSSSLVVLKESLRVLNVSLAAELASSLDSLHEGFRKGAASDAIEKIKALVDGKIKNVVISSPYSKERLKALLKQIVAFGAKESFLQYEDAEQVLMAVSALSAGISPNKPLYEKEIGTLYEATENEEGFDAEGFQTAMKTLQTKL